MLEEAEEKDSRKITIQITLSWFHSLFYFFRVRKVVLSNSIQPPLSIETLVLLSLIIAGKFSDALKNELT